MIAPLAMVRGMPARVPRAKEIPIVSLVEPRSLVNMMQSINNRNLYIYNIHITTNPNYHFMQT